MSWIINSLAGGVGGGTFSLNGSTGSVSLVAGANITLNSNLSTITIAAGGGETYSVNGFTSSVSISAGQGIGIGQALSTVTISYSGTSNFTGMSLSGNSVGSTAFTGNSILWSFGGAISALGTTNASGGTISLQVNVPVNSVNGSNGQITITGGPGIALSTALARSITISYSGTSNFTGISWSGNTTTAVGNSATAFSGNSLIWSAAGILSMSGTTNASGGTITLSVPAPAATNVVTSLNGSNGSISISAGAGIGIGQANSTITISASVQTSSLSVTALGNTLGALSTSIAISNALNISGAGIVSVGMNGSTITISAPAAAAGTVSLTALGNTTSSSSGTFNNLLNISGAGIASVGVGNGSITISVTTPSVTNFSTITATMAGNTLGAASTTLTIGNSFSVSGAGEISVGASAGTITISSPLVTNFSLNGTSSSVSLVAGANIGFASGASSITISAGPLVNSIGAAGSLSSGPITLSGGNNITVSSNGAGVVLISNGALSKLSYTQNISLERVSNTIVSTAGTVTGISTSLFLHRIALLAPMALSEVDIAMSIGFPATSQGAGTMSRSFVLYSFGNATSISSLASVSSTSAWSTGTSTTAGAVSLTQFQGGWSTPLIQPMTFASTLIPAGEYVVGQMFNFGQGSSTWTVNLYGGWADSTIQLAAATGVTSATLGALSSGGLLAGSAFTASASSTLTAWTATPLGLQVMGSAGLSSFGSALRLFSVTNSTTGITMGATASAGAVSGLSAISTGTFTTLAGSFHTASQSGSAFNAVGTAGFALLGSTGLLAGSFLTASGSLSAVTNVGLAALGSTTVGQLTLPNFGFIGTGSTTSGLPTNFNVGIFGLGTTAFPASIALTSSAVTISGSAAFQQPWFALAGA